MAYSAESLYDAAMNDTFEMTPSALCDYFGFSRYINDHASQTIIMGIWQGLITRELLGKTKTAIVETLHTALLENKLDELVHSEYTKLGKTGYYHQFCTNKITLNCPF